MPRPLNTEIPYTYHECSRCKGLREFRLLTNPRKGRTWRCRSCGWFDYKANPHPSKVMYDDADEG